MSQIYKESVVMHWYGYAVSLVARGVGAFCFPHKWEAGIARIMSWTQVVSSTAGTSPPEPSHDPDDGLCDCE